VYNCPTCQLKGVRRRELCNECCRKAKKEVSLGEYCGIGVAATEGGVLQRESRIGVAVKEGGLQRESRIGVAAKEGCILQRESLISVMVMKLMKKTTDRETTNAVLRHFSDIY
jgi:hypothetical protein